MRYDSSMFRKKDISFLFGLFLLLLVLASAVAIFFIDDYSPYFLASYIIPFVLILLFGRRIPKEISVIARILLGLLFIFSGFVKGVDPFGTGYKVQDYLIAYNMPEWFMQFALYIAIVLNLVEFTIGVMLLLNLKIKFSVVITTLMMIFFTITTLIDAITNLVPDCGCFGEAVKMTNWQTFYKNLTINLLLLILILTFRKKRSILIGPAQVIIAILFGVAFLGFEYYNIKNLPVIDFRDWKVGKDMKVENPKPVEYWVVYSNIYTLEDTTMLVSDIPYNDKDWMEEWEFKSQKVIDNNKYNHHLILIDENGVDQTRNVIERAQPNIFVISHNLENLKVKDIEKLEELSDICFDLDYPISFITASDYEVYEELINNYNINSHFYNADDIELKTVIRSNPGIIAMKNGIILKKWSRYNIPDKEELESVLGN